MDIDKANSTVSLARNIVALTNELKAMFSKAIREQQRYSSLISESSAEHHDRFGEVAGRYFGIISMLHADLAKAKEPTHVLTSLNEMMTRRDELLMERSSLRGAAQGVVSILELDAPEKLSRLIEQYKDYITCTTSFFYVTEEGPIAGSSWCSDLFELAYYAFKDDSDDGELDPFGSIEMQSLRDGNILSKSIELELACDTVISEAEKCRELLERRMIMCNEKFSALHTSLVHFS